ncbi:hypothetical protein K439DRAFT_1616024 [Ramaria rubella]|nr:hypothetical protein K439DRAFT_1616024 [Ramaria rubella]
MSSNQMNPRKCTKDEDLIDAKNGAYLAMIMRNTTQEAEIRATKEAFALLIDKINNLNTSASPPTPPDTHFGLSIHPILNKPFPDHAECPDVTYWTRKDWDQSNS